jgi:hypothetical protein
MLFYSFQLIISVGHVCIIGEGCFSGVLYIYIHLFVVSTPWFIIGGEISHFIYLVPWSLHDRFKYYFYVLCPLAR